jgi:hypothetical protein
MLSMNQHEADLNELRALNARFIHNFVTNDVAAHAAITHPRFLYIATSGARVERAEYLRAWATGFDPSVIVYWDLRDERVDLFGGLALVRATNKQILRSGDQEVTGMTAYSDTYVREGGRWLCVQAQLTAVAPEHYPGDETIVRPPSGRLCHWAGCRTENPAGFSRQSVRPGQGHSCCHPLLVCHRAHFHVRSKSSYCLPR